MEFGDVIRAPDTSVVSDARLMVITPVVFGQLHVMVLKPSAYTGWDTLTVGTTWRTEAKLWKKDESWPA